MVMPKQRLTINQAELAYQILTLEFKFKKPMWYTVNCTASLKDGRQIRNVRPIVQYVVIVLNKWIIYYIFYIAVCFMLFKCIVSLVFKKRNDILLFIAHFNVWGVGLYNI